MKVYIANPLYDAAFKRIMEEERIAKRSCLRFCKEKSSVSRYAKMDSAISKAIAFRYLRWDLLPA